MNPYAAYGARVSAQSSREQEATAFRLAARHLNEAESRPERNRALNINHEMWSILFRELNSSACALPEILKADCIKLALWSLEYSTKAVLSDVPLSPLVEVNNTMAEGLEANNQPAADPTASALPSGRSTVTAMCM